jgi:hypothetical protein
MRGEKEKPFQELNPKKLTPKRRRRRRRLSLNKGNRSAAPKNLGRNPPTCKTVFQNILFEKKLFFFLWGKGTIRASFE